MSTTLTRVYAGNALARYAFGGGHPFGPGRYEAFYNEFERRGLSRRVSVSPPEIASIDEIQWFHTDTYVARVMGQSESGGGFLDWGDTPAFHGVFEAASTVVGTTLAALDAIVRGECRRAFVPIAGLHHARRDGAAGFCVFNDCGVAIEACRRRYDFERIAYVDIDAHHGDGVYYGFESDPDVVIADFHEDGRYLYPGTGGADETGSGVAVGTKLNIPLLPGSGDTEFLRSWDHAESFLRAARPEMILLQCGVDSLACDPLAPLNYSVNTHRHVTLRLCALAAEYGEGRLLALGGGGYALENIATGWNSVVETLAEAP